MATERLVVELVAEVKGAVKNLKQYTNEAKKSAKSIGGLSKIIKSYYAEILAGVLIARKVISVTKNLIKSYTDQEVAESKLTAALKATGRWSLEAETALHEFASEMQMTTGISDDLLIATEGIMTTFTKISTETFPEALEAAANMSKMFGQDLRQSTIQLGTALNDPIMGVGRLKRIGISFSVEQKKSIELFMAQNDIMSAQRVILDELELEIGGVAKAYGQTLAGQQDIVNEKFGELKEQLGFLVSQNMPAFFEMTSAVIEKMSSWIGKIVAARTEIAAFRKALSGMSEEELQTLIDQQDVYIDSLVDVIFPIQKQIEALEKLEKRTRAERKELKNLNKQYDELIPTYDEALVKMNDYRMALEEVEKRNRLLGLATDETIKPMEDLNDLVIVWRDQMALASLDAGLFTAALREQKEVIEELTEATFEYQKTYAGIADAYAFTAQAAKEAAEAQRNVFEDIATVAVASFDIINSATSMSFQNQKTELNDWYQAKKKIVDQELADGLVAHQKALEDLQAELDAKLISEDEYDAAKAVLNEEYYAKQNELEEEMAEKSRKLKIKQAKAEKKMAILGIIVNTALAVAKVWGQTGIFGLAAQLLPIAMGIAQVAIVASQKIPTFQYGGIVPTQRQVGGVGYGDRVPVMLEPKEVVIDKFTAQKNAAQIGAMRSGEIGGQTINLVLDGRVLAKWIYRASTNKLVTINQKAIVS